MGLFIGGAIVLSALIYFYLFVSYPGVYTGMGLSPVNASGCGFQTWRPYPLGPPMGVTCVPIGLSPCRNGVCAMFYLNGTKVSGNFAMDSYGKECRCIALEPWPGDLIGVDWGSASVQSPRSGGEAAATEVP
jgi:hypothetical protein